MEELPGQRANTRTFRWANGDKFYYHIDTRVPGGYICISHTSRCQCPVRVVNVMGDYHEYSGERVHTHGLPSYRREKFQLSAILKLKALQLPSVAPGELFDLVCRDNRAIAFVSTRSAGIMTIIRARQRNAITPPASMAELGPMLSRYLPVDAIYRGHVQATDQSNAIIFASEEMMARLNTTRKLHVDGTFKSIPEAPPSCQLLIIYMRIMDVGIAAVYALCERKTTSMYNAVFEFLVSQAPRLRDNIRAVYGDYESAVIASVRVNLPFAAFRGCWIHSIRAVTRKWNSLGLRDAPSEALYLTWALPLAPAAQFEAGINIIAGESRLIEPQYERVILFINYLRNQWLPLAEIVSVFGNPGRTNNIAEGFNNQIVRKFGGPYPQLGDFLYKLANVIQDVEIKWERLQAHHDLDRMRRTHQIADDRHIQLKQISLINNECSLKQFLETAMVSRLRDDVARHVNDPAFLQVADELNFPDAGLLRDPQGIVYEPPRDVPRRDVLNLRPRVLQQRFPGGHDPHGLPREQRDRQNPHQQAQIQPPQPGIVHEQQDAPNHHHPAPVQPLRAPFVHRPQHAQNYNHPNAVQPPGNAAEPPQNAERPPRVQNDLRPGEDQPVGPGVQRPVPYQAQIDQRQPQAAYPRPAVGRQPPYGQNHQPPAEARRHRPVPEGGPRYHRHPAEAIPHRIDAGPDQPMILNVREVLDPEEEPAAAGAALQREGARGKTRGRPPGRDRDRGRGRGRGRQEPEERPQRGRGRGRPSGRPRGRDRDRGGRGQDNVELQDPVLPRIAEIERNNLEEPIVIDDNSGDEFEPPIIIIDDDDVNRGPAVYDQLNLMQFADETVEQAQNRFCCICRENIPKIIFLPCNHLCICLRCDSILENVNVQELRRNGGFIARCPLPTCQEPFESKTRVRYCY